MKLLKWFLRRPHAVPLFELGGVVVTPSAAEALARTGTTAEVLLQRHVLGDWGESDLLDIKQNVLGLKLGLRLRSIYSVENVEQSSCRDPSTRTGRLVTVWVITSSTRSQTTVLLPEEVFYG